MKLENIFGMHLGCKVEHNKKRFSLNDVDQCYAGTDGGVFDIDQCKLVLKPLSAIAEKDVPKLEEHFLKDRPYESVVGWQWDFNLDGFLVYYKVDSACGVLFDRHDTMFLLASLGYDIGIVPDEYKIVKEE